MTCGDLDRGQIVTVGLLVEGIDPHADPGFTLRVARSLVAQLKSTAEWLGLERAAHLSARAALEKERDRNRELERLHAESAQRVVELERAAEDPRAVRSHLVGDYASVDTRPRSE